MSSVQRQNALAFIARMDAREYHALADLMAETFTHRFLPASLNGFGVPVRSKQQFLDHLRALEPTFDRFNFQQPKEIIEAEDVVVLHLVTDGQTASGKPYKNEYMFTFRFEGERIESIKEFMDSKYVSHILEGENNSSSTASSKSEEV